MLSQATHIPVMCQEAVEALHLCPGSCIVDCTLGTGGHAFQILQQIGSKGCLIGIDRDSHSLEKAKGRLREFSGRCDFVHQDFRYLDQVLEDLGMKSVDGFLFDLGISSYQLQDAQRGFSLKNDGPLDMRMDQNTYISAYDLVNSLSEREIASILRTFGEERWSNRIAHYLVARRNDNPISSTRELTDAVLRAVPHSYLKQHIHPATRTFQAFRIAVNRELEALEMALDKCPQYLKKGGRLVVIAFHSLEDRIVKEKIRQFSRSGTLNIITKKPLRPQEEETEYNPRSRSARLRIAEKI